MLGITGLVSDDAKVTVLRRWVATNAPDAQVEVETIDGMAAAANDLLAAQNADGGFGAGPGQSSGGLYTGWTALGLAAAGRNPLDVQRRGRSVVDYLETNVGQVSDLGEIERIELKHVPDIMDLVLPVDFDG